MSHEVKSQLDDNQQQIVWDQAVLDKYNYSGPRYTSYPTALEFHEMFTVSDYDMACTQYQNARYLCTSTSHSVTSFVTTVAVIK
ncbi:coproporphyrinogen III oxidase [Vibrio astriarenae]|nr:coproporphyrinogen III oxidase [Vibrio sp. C7]